MEQSVTEKEKILDGRLDKIFEERKNQRTKDNIFWTLENFRYNEKFANDDRISTLTDIYDNIGSSVLDLDGSKKLRKVAKSIISELEDEQCEARQVRMEQQSKDFMACFLFALTMIFTVVFTTRFAM